MQHDFRPTAEQRMPLVNPRHVDERAVVDAQEARRVELHQYVPQGVAVQVRTGPTWMSR